MVIGTDDARCLEVLYSLYRPILDQTFAPPPYLPRPEGMGAVPLISADLASAELIKYAANAFLALKISYINEIGQLSEKVGADIQQVAKGIGLDARIGMRFLQSGIGWGGSCFGKDTSALVSTAAEYNLTMPIVEAAREINRRQRERVVDKLLGELKILKGRTIGLLGLAFKPNTDDLREASGHRYRAQAGGARLQGKGARSGGHGAFPARVFRILPRWAVNPPKMWRMMRTRWSWSPSGINTWSWIGKRWPKQMRSRIVLDGRNALDRARLTRFGYKYLGIAG